MSQPPPPPPGQPPPPPPGQPAPSQGWQMPPAQYQSGYAVPKTSGLAIASLVTGIVGLCGLWFPSIAAVICGHLALDKMRDTDGAVGGKGLAIAGVVLGWIVLGGTAIAAVVFASFVVLR